MNPQQFGPWLTAAIILALTTFSVSLIPYFIPSPFATFLEKWRSLNPPRKFGLVGILIGLTAFAGTKPSSGDDSASGGPSTNDVTIVEGDSTNSVPDDTSSPTNTPPPSMMQARPKMRQQVRPEVSFLEDLTTVENWTARGAYCDWIHVAFPDGFAFPSGTNFLTGVTVMAYGELRSQVEVEGGRRMGYALVSLPQPVSIEPDASSFSHGLTSSNSFLFSWSNVCVDRAATNRVDASIELFDSGDMTMRFGSTVTNILARPPEGFDGLNQDDVWIAANFPDDYDVITNKGYSTWLMDDKVGHNEPNGLYKVDVTIAALPEHGPCYLVVGPYQMTVTHPGTYSFPLEVFVEYHARTYPEAVPLSFDYDDGYRVDSAPPYLMMSSPARLGAPNNQEHDYVISYDGKIYCDPSWIDIESADGRSVYLSCNASHVSQITYEASNPGLVMAIRSRSRAEIIQSLVGGCVTFIAECGEHTAFGSLYVSQPWPPYTPDPDHQDEDPTSTNDWNSASSTNDTPTATQP